MTPFPYAVAAICTLFDQNRELMPVLDEQLTDTEGQFLTTSILSDVVRWMAVDRETRLRTCLRVIEWMESAYERGPEETREVIATGAVEMLPAPGEPGAELRILISPALRRFDPWMGQAEWGTPWKELPPGFYDWKIHGVASSYSVAAVGSLVDQNWELIPLLEEQLATSDGDVRPSATLESVIRWMSQHVETHLRTCLRVIEWMESAYERGPDEVRELIRVSGVAQLPRGNDRGAHLRLLLSPTLRALEA